MGAIPNKLTGFQDIKTNTEARARFEAGVAVPIPPEPGWHLSLMFEARSGASSPPATSSARTRCAPRPNGLARKLLDGLEHFVVQDIFLTDTAAIADVGVAGHGHLVRGRGDRDQQRGRVQRGRKALEPPSGARDDIEIICEIARRLGADWATRPLRTSGTSCVPCHPCTRP